MSKLVYPPTLIIRHRKENLKKCSLRGLESKEDLIFTRYPNPTLPDLSCYIVLAMDAPLLSPEDEDHGIVLIDGTWKYAAKIYEQTPALHKLEKRSLPKLETAYPRRQDDCKDPSAGLASIEALYCAHKILNRDCESLLEHYHWKEQFLERNKKIIDSQISS